MRIAFVSDAEAVNSNYRAYQPMSELHRRGAEIRFNRIGEPAFELKSLRICDAVLVHRYIGADARSAMQQLASEGVGIAWDNDDDLTNVPRTNPHYARFAGLNRQRVGSDLAKTMELADVVTTPSQVLAQQFRSLGAQDVRTVENFLPPEFASTHRAPHAGVVIACLAGLEHQVDYDRLGIRDVMLELLRRHADLRVLNIGLGLGLPAERCDHISLVDFLQLSATLARADIGLAPLVDIPWNRARSNVKLKEYGSASLAWLASPVGAYRALGEREGGRLVDDGRWLDAIERLVVKGRERRSLAKRARRWATGESILRNGDIWERVFHDAAERGRLRARR